ncbi:MAG: hypothetical protein WBQ68_11305 [Terriglobales bacterium]
MPNRLEKTPEAPSPSELNPLTNPILEQNLGRWAKVYFSNPPGKRDQAVNKLLEELKRESGSVQTSRPYFATETKFQRAVCSACQHQNPPGHKFCSRCGQVLAPAQPPATETPAVNRISEAPPVNSGDEAPWLREQTFNSLDDYEIPRSRGWKYLTAAAVIVLAGFAYMQWVPGARTRVATDNPPQVSAPASELPPANASPSEAKSSPETVAPKPVVPNAIAPESKMGNAPKPSATTKSHNHPVVPAGVQAAVQKSPMIEGNNPHRIAADDSSNDGDLRLAQRYLGGSMGVRDSSEAAKLLWKAVGKQNATAAVLLSDLYLRGDGVPRSCDQARLLLIAAAKRGSPLAAQGLRNLESLGCR